MTSDTRTGNQLFRAVPDHKVVFSVLDEVCHRDQTTFVVDDVIYKRMRYDDRIFKLYDYLKPFYHLSKQKYVNGCTTRTGFLTVLRQLCNLFGIQYTSKVVYRNGTYSNALVIYLDRHDWQELPEPTTVVMA